MDRRTIGLIWLGGIALAALIYAIGPEQFLTWCATMITNFAHFVDELVATLMWRAFELMRAAAIALFVVFVVLAMIAMQRGMRMGGMLLVISIVFLLLIRTDWYDPGTKWLAAAILAAVGAGIATKRLLHAPPPREARDPWGFAKRKE
jgi:hypothetical protein